MHNFHTKGNEILFVHIGENVGVKSSEIIGIFDLENATKSDISRRFLVKAEKESIVTYVNEKVPRTFIVTQNKQCARVFLTQLTAKTIAKRTINNNKEICNG